MTSVTVKAQGFSVPAVCVACGAPVSPDWKPDLKASAVEATSYSREGNTVTNRKVRFPLCTTCIEARTRMEARKTNYPGFWWTRSVGWLGILVLIGFFVKAQDAPNSSLTMSLFTGFVVIEAAAIVLGKILRRRNDQANPAGEADSARVARIEQAVGVSPPDHTPLMRVTFANDAVAQAWLFANTQSGIGGLL